MTVSRGRRTVRQSQAHKRNPERSRHGSRMSNGQRRFIRKLIYVLADIIDEKEDLELDEDSVYVVGDGENVSSDGEEESVETMKDPSPNLFSPEPKDTTNIARFEELCNTHRQLTSQIQSSLKALGGGDRAAKALEDMHTGIYRIEGACCLLKNKIRINPSYCSSVLNETYGAASKVMRSFHELGVFNITFFKTIQALMNQLKTIARKLEIEYGSDDNYYMDVGNASNYINFLWGELDFDFEAFLDQLAVIAEKEIAAIQQTQDFSSQRYLNLTTIATFLSSVTATTLQITAGDPASILETLINTLWFLSLVFSTASAVYSLLVMTWRQSSVRQPDKSLPPWANSWLRNGPMYALIVALLTFSIGLCLLAFEVMDQQGHLASAVVPTAFAGIHVYAIIIVSAYFLSEQWKERRGKSWGRLVAITQPVAEKARNCGSRLRDYGSQMRQYILPIYTSLTMVFNYIRNNETADLETGQATFASSPVSSHLGSDTDQQLFSEPTTSESDEREDAEPENAIPQRATPSPDNESESNNLVDDAQNIIKRELPFERLLEFSPDGIFLAYGFSNKLIVYTWTFQGMDPYLVHGTHSLPEGDRVLQLVWSSKNELLVRTSHKLFIWKYDQIEDSHFDEPSVIPFEQYISAVRWLETGTGNISTFVCASGNMVKSFNINCEKLWSLNLLEMLTVVQMTVMDIVPMNATHMLCLATRPVESRDPWYRGVLITVLLMINTSSGSIESLSTNHRYLAVSEKAQIVLVYGGDYTTLFSIESFAPMQLREYTTIYKVNSMSTFYFYEKAPGVIIEAFKGHVRLLYQPSKGGLFSTLHSFTMQNEKANAPNPTCFAINQAFNPYIFAFGDESGSVYIWFIQSDRGLETSNSAKISNVEDRLERRQEPIISAGRFMILPPPEDTEPM